MNNLAKLHFKEQHKYDMQAIRCVELPDDHGQEIHKATSAAAVLSDYLLSLYLLVREDKEAMDQHNILNEAYLTLVKEGSQAHRLEGMVKKLEAHRTKLRAEILKLKKDNEILKKTVEAMGDNVD